MGRILTNIKIENAVDSSLAQQGRIPSDEVRKIEVEALVDTGASLLCLPKSQIETLGLRKIGTRQVTTATGKVERDFYGDARLTVLNRDCAIDVIELPENTPVLLGYIALENLDLIPDPTKETLYPAHGDEVVLDLY